MTISLADMWWAVERAYRVGFIDGAAGSPKGHASDFGEGGYDALVARANVFATRYAALRAKDFPAGAPVSAVDPSRSIPEVGHPAPAVPLIHP